MLLVSTDRDTHIGRPGSRSQRILLVFTMAGIFSERALLHFGADIKFFYLVLLLCLPLLLWNWDFLLPRNYLLLNAYLLASGGVALVAGTVPAKGLITEGSGIFVSSFFYLLFLRYQRRSIAEVFDLYAICAFWVSVAGFPLAALDTVTHGSIQPIRSILLEPAHFCQLVIPAFFYFSVIPGRIAKLRMLFTLTAILCSVSSTGIIALMLALILLLRKHRLGLILIPAIVAPIALTLYATSDHFRLRVEDSVGGLTSSDLTGVNLSTYTLLSNVYVTQRVLEDYPWFGTGLGSYEKSHARYITSLPGVESFLGSYAYTANAKDANSLLLRIASEFGIAGVAGLAFLLIRYRPSQDPRSAAIGYAALLYFFMKLFREGHYFSPEMYFFVWTYIFVSRRCADGINARSSIGNSMFFTAPLPSGASA